MGIKYYYKGNKSTRKFLETTLGYSKVRARIAEARKTWARDPYIQCDWMDGMCVVLVV